MSQTLALREIQDGMRQHLDAMPTSLVFGLMGYLNAGIGCAAITAGAIEKQENGRYQLIPNAARTFLDKSRRGLLSIALSTKWVSEYLNQYWPRASSCPSSVRKIRDILANTFGIFEFTPKEKTPWRKGQKRPDPPTLERFDHCKGLALYEACEQSLKERGVTLDEFPLHRGAVMVELFNLAFYGIAKFGRIDNLLMGAWGMFEEAVEAFEDLFFVGSRIAGKVADAIFEAMQREERSYYSEADIPY